MSGGSDPHYTNEGIEAWGNMAKDMVELGSVGTQPGPEPILPMAAPGWWGAGSPVTCPPQVSNNSLGTWRKVRVSSQALGAEQGSLGPVGSGCSVRGSVHTLKTENLACFLPPLWLPQKCA